MALNFEDSAHKSMTKLIWTRFLEHRLAAASLITILLFLMMALSAPLISALSRVDPISTNVFQRYNPPGSRLPVSSAERSSILETFIDQHPDQAQLVYEKLLARHKISEPGDFTEALLIWVETRSHNNILADLASLEPDPETNAVRRVVDTFCVFHPLGTDELGRDVLIRLIYGARVSIGVGLIVALASALIGLLIGSVAGFYGGALDSLLMRATDSLLSLPQMPVLIVFAAVDLSRLPGLSWLISEESESLTKLIIILCLFSWMTVARIVRGSVLSLREREYVLASRTLGASDHTLILTHLLPNVLAPLLVTVTVNVGQSVLYEAALSFLGLGIQPPTPSWGNMLSNAQELVSVAPLLALLPGLLIFITVISFNFIGDGLQEAINPKSVQR